MLLEASNMVCDNRETQNTYVRTVPKDWSQPWRTIATHFRILFDISILFCVEVTARKTLVTKLSVVIYKVFDSGTLMVASRAYQKILHISIAEQNVKPNLSLYCRPEKTAFAFQKSLSHWQYVNTVGYSVWREWHCCTSLEFAVIAKENAKT